MNKNSDTGIWDLKECALILIDYQPEVMDTINDKDPKFVELNAIALAKMALKFNIPIVLSTVAVKMGVDSPTLSSLQDIIPDVIAIDRTTMDAWDDEAFVKAVKATGRKKLVMAGIITSVCLAYPVVHALSEGYQVMVIEDAVGDRTKEAHDYAMLRMIQAGAIPNTSIAMIAEWFRDWALPIADKAREVLPPYLVEFNKLQGLPQPRSVPKNKHAEQREAH